MILALQAISRKANETNAASGMFVLFLIALKPFSYFTGHGRTSSQSIDQAVAAEAANAAFTGETSSITGAVIFFWLHKIL